jgi:hypothetical protein
MSRKLLITLMSVLAMGAMAISASAASASERIWEDEAFTKLAPEESNFSAINSGSAVLKANNGLEITCPTSTIGGTIGANKVTSTTASIQSVVFGGECKDNKTPSAFVKVKTNTTTPWTLTWTAADTFALTGIKATIEDGAAVCNVANAGAFELKWTNKVKDSTLAASAAPVTLSPAATCPATAGTETVTYSINGAPDKENNLWLH